MKNNVAILLFIIVTLLVVSYTPLLHTEYVYYGNNSESQQCEIDNDRDDMLDSILLEDLLTGKETLAILARIMDSHLLEFIIAHEKIREIMSANIQKNQNILNS